MITILWRILKNCNANGNVAPADILRIHCTGSTVTCIRLQNTFGEYP